MTKRKVASVDICYLNSCGEPARSHWSQVTETSSAIYSMSFSVFVVVFVVMCFWFCVVVAFCGCALWMCLCGCVFVITSL